MNEPHRISISNPQLFPEIKALIAAGHTVTLVVRGHSMNPFLVDRRDKIILSPLRKEPQPGDLLLAYESARQRYVVHRFLKKEGLHYLLMGDGNLKETESIRKEDLLGTVTAVIRKNKTYKSTSLYWKYYSTVWTFLLPVRGLLLAVWKRM